MLIDRGLKFFFNVIRVNLKKESSEDKNLVVEYCKRERKK